jgi:hypothetical protein
MENQLSRISCQYQRQAAIARYAAALFSEVEDHCPISCTGSPGNGGFTYAPTNSFSQFPYSQVKKLSLAGLQPSNS